MRTRSIWGVLVVLLIACAACSTPEVSTATVAGCPRCGGTETTEVLYGLVVYDSALQARIKNKEVVLGGCVVSDDSPKYICRKCRHKWGREW